MRLGGGRHLGDSSRRFISAIHLGVPPIRVLERLLSRAGRLDVVGARPVVRAVHHELAQRGEVRCEDALRVREHLGHLRPRGECVGAVHVANARRRAFSASSLRSAQHHTDSFGRASPAAARQPHRSRDSDLARSQFARRSRHVCPTGCRGIGPAAGARRHPRFKISREGICMRPPASP